MKKWKLTILQQLLVANFLLVFGVLWSFEQPAATYKLSETYETRNIASTSLSPDQHTSVEKFQEMLVYDLPCSQQEIETSAEYIRLKMTECLEQAKKQSVENRSTGAKAVLFDQQKGILSTDFIKLRDGHNQIEIRWQDENGNSQMFQVAVNRTNF